MTDDRKPMIEIYGEQVFHNMVDQIQRRIIRFNRIVTKTSEVVFSEYGFGVFSGGVTMTSIYDTAKESISWVITTKSGKPYLVMGARLSIALSDILAVDVEPL